MENTAVAKMKTCFVSACALMLLVGSSRAFAPQALQASSITRRSTPLNARPQTRFRQVQGNILTRRTINEFSPTLPIGWERSLELAVEAAVHAPNHKRSEPWRFHLLGPASIERVCRLNAEMVAVKKGEAAGEKKLQRWLNMPGWLVVTCKGGTGGGANADAANPNMEDPMGLAREDYAACCCAVQNLCLSLNAQGLGTKWTTGAVNFDQRFAQAVGFDHKEEYTVGTIWFGTPLNKSSPPPKKKNLDQVFRRVD